MPTIRPPILAAVLAAAAPLAAQAQQNAPDEAFAQLGCAGCHGTGGDGTHAGPSVTQGGLALEDFVAAVRSPRDGIMPAYPAETVTDQALERIYASLAPSQAPPDGDARRGAELYSAYGCYACHSNQAQGILHGPRLGPDVVSYARFSWYVRHPTAQMPPYSTAVMSEQDMADVYAFVEALPAPPPVEEIPLLAP